MPLADCGGMPGASFLSLLASFSFFSSPRRLGIDPGRLVSSHPPKGGTPMRPLSQELEAGGTRKVGWRLRGRLGALLVLATAGAFQPAAAQQAQTARITGKVTDGTSGA